MNDRPLMNERDVGPLRSRAAGLLCGLAALLCLATPARAQYELKASNANALYQGALPAGNNQGTQPQNPANSNFRGAGQVSGSSGPVSSLVLSSTGNGTSIVTVGSTTSLVRGMSVTGTGITTPARIVNIISSTSYELSIILPAGTANRTYTAHPGALLAGKTAILMTRSSIGGVFSSGVPRYFLGDVMTPPLVDAANQPFPGATDAIRLAAARAYWRQKPVAPGELLTPFYSAAGGLVPAGATPIPTTNVTVTASNTTTTSGTLVTVSAAVPQLVPGAILLGQPITAVNGLNVTLAGPANEVITSGTPKPIFPASSYYYSPHAEKVFASQPGRVTVLWTTLSTTANGGYETLSETFAVSSTTNAPVRTIFWTEGSFDGPKVQITDSRITTVNPVYYNTVPKAVAQEVSIPGYVPITPNLTTLSFDKFTGIGQLHAYNVEGRIFVEYLGNVRLAPNVYDHVGFDIVDLVRVPASNYFTRNLGRELVPHDLSTDLTPSPVLSTQQQGSNFYGTTVRADGSAAYYAERETSAANEPDNDSPASVDAYNKVVFYWMQTGGYSIQWPKFQDRYWLRWSPVLADYAHYTVDPAGSTAATGVSFAGGALPQIIYQDDPAQAEAKIDLPTQRLFVDLTTSTDKRNRSLLKFKSASSVWYVNVYTQAEDRAPTRAVTTNGSATITLTGVATTAGLEKGMVVTGPGISGTATIVSITDTTHFQLSVNAAVNGTFSFSVESDGQQPIAVSTVATVGTRIPPPAGHENAGYIDSGTGYYPKGYLNPFVVGVEEANKGAIIPVNSLPTNNVLNVRWFKKVTAPSADFQNLYVPGKIGRYTVSYPATTTPQIVIAEGVGTNDLTGAEAAGALYYQNDSTQPGYNPNEEHALPLGPRVYALRDDLNITSGAGYTSQPFVLVAYTNGTDGRPDMHAYKVVRTAGAFAFEYTATAGTQLTKPYPLPLMPLAMVGTGVNRTAKDIEIVSPDPLTNTTVAADAAYKNFTFKDRKGFTWLHRGSHAGGSPTLTMKLYYLSRAGFFVPGSPGSGEPAVGTVLPFLRPAARSGQIMSLTAIDDGQLDQPLPIIYRPAWPANPPELRVGETLTLPKFNLPQVRGQKSAQIYYQQSIAQAAPATLLTKNSVTLHDPTREKIIALDDAAVGLDKLPAALKITASRGKTYFQGLPPHLQTRLYLDPARGAKGTLVFTGVFHEEIAGDDYLDLNLLTAAEETAVKGLIAASATDKAKWDAAIDALNTRVETFKPDPAQFGSYTVDTSKNVDVGENDLAIIKDPNTAVDSYAVTATGQGTGFVTMVFGNGNAFTPEGDSVTVHVFKVASQLYVGDLKLVKSSNPLDEQVTLRHSGDFAGRPEDYEFEWRWATGEASEPGIYATTMAKRLGDPAATPAATDKWIIVSDPGGIRPTTAQYTAAGAAQALGSRDVHPASYTDADRGAGFPALCAKSSVGVDFASGVPGSIVLSLDIGTHDGLVLYVNGRTALAYNAPEPQFTLTNSRSGLTNLGKASAGGNDRLKQFAIAPSYFTAAVNTIEIALYSTADLNAVSALTVVLEAAQEVDLVTTGTTWQTAPDPTGKNTNTAIIGGDPANPFGGPQFVLNDRWFTMRYKPKAGTGNVLGTPYSRWMPPQSVEGWVKRVLAAINPFEQRVKDLFNNQVNTDVSVITQAGKRWEGDIALNMDTVNDAGLIEIYETVLNRAKNMSINAAAPVNDPDTNNALILAAGYLNDLYTLLGNEAYADAANPTISIDDQTNVTEVNTSRFSFESQVPNSLEEELALLKGRDDSVSPGVRKKPAYNRLYWNYTHGINSGEVIYAVNYNIKEKVGGTTADGVVDESDAQRMFPQGHGDAYGHYLTALTGYYRLLASQNFTWTPRAEAMTVLGQAVTVDFLDERKFAAAAGNLARTAGQIVGLTYRQSYKDDPGAGWASYRDSKPTNTSTTVTSHQGLDEWASRSTQGAYLNWVVGNALVPDVDPYHTGVQKIDRTTVPELPQLAAAAETFQTSLDNASAHLNPLGLSPGAIAFDISPGDLQSGQSHFEQIAARSLLSLTNAAGAFNQAATMTRSLRDQQNQVDDYATAIAEQESAYVNQLIDIYGRPYSGEIGAGKTYAQGYIGPDLFHWFIVDRPNELVNTSESFSVTIASPSEYKLFTGNTIDDLVATLAPADTVNVTVKVNPSQWVQYNDVWKSGGLGSRAETGELQSALQDAQQSWLALSDVSGAYRDTATSLTRAIEVFRDVVKTHQNQLEATDAANKKARDLSGVILALNSAADALEFLASFHDDTADSIAEFFPKVVGLATDATSGPRGLALLVGATGANIEKGLALASRIAAGGTELQMLGDEQALGKKLDQLGFSNEELQLATELEGLYREHIGHAEGLMQLTLDHQRALQQVNNVRARGDRILAEREVFRQRAAAIIQGYRTKDLAFRVFRNEALEQYRSLFDLASRYTYLAAKSYDYETGLLGSPQGQTVFAKIVAARSLGDLTDGVPQSTVSTLGDAGLAGTMAQLNADFSVAEGRLGINNPDQNGTVFSLRRELYRLLDLPGITNDDAAWRQTLEQHIVANVLSDSDVATQCRNIKKPDGTPVPGIVIPFSTSILHGRNFFGLNLAGADHYFSPSSFATKIYNTGIAFPGYVGMDAYAAGEMGAGLPASNDPNALSATPYVYLIPCGNDYMLAPPFGDTGGPPRTWTVQDQALPLPYNLGATAFNTTQFFNANGTLSEQPWILRKHQAFRAVADASLFYGSVPAEFTSSRLVGRSVWNDRWKIVIPAYSLLNNEQAGLDRFTASVKDIQLFLRTYSNAGN